jgi:hypothetical protein
MDELVANEFRKIQVSTPMSSNYYVIYYVIYGSSPVPWVCRMHLDISLGRDMVSLMA